MTTPQPDPSAQRPSPASTGPDRGGTITRDENGVVVIPGIPGDHVALASANTTDFALEIATRVAASAGNTPKPVDPDFLTSLQPHPGGVHEEA